LEEIGHRLIELLSQNLPGRTKNLNQDSQLQSEHPPNMNVERYNYANPFNGMDKTIGHLYLS
jgi:hypothetical protein